MKVATSPGASGRLRAAGPHLADAAGRAGTATSPPPAQGRAGVLAGPARLRPRARSRASRRSPPWSGRCCGTSRTALLDQARPGPARPGRVPPVPLLGRGRRPPFQARWALVASAAEVLLEADRVAKALKNAPTTVPALVEAYAEGDEPWCLLDTHHRHMESRWYNFESDAGDDHRGLEKLIIKAEQRYTEVGSDAGQALRHPLRRRPSTRSRACCGSVEIFETQVKPRLGRGQGRLRLGRCPAVRDGP